MGMLFCAMPSFGAGGLSPARPVRVLTADDQPFVHAAVRVALRPFPEVQVVGQVESADAVRDAARRLDADVVLLDIDMPGGDPFDLIAQMQAVGDPARVVLYSAYCSPHMVDRALTAGAWGYITKGEPIEDLLRAVRAVAAGESYFGPTATGMMP